jgi:predicted AlkP superfamily pyrophosphatase or phosphodiesterase
MSAGLRILVVCLAVFGITTRVPAERQAPRAADHVVLISLDGFPSWAMDDPYLPVPTLRALAGRGAIARTMRPVNPTVTWPNHTTFVTGVRPAKHGVLFNGILVREPGVPPRVEPWRDKSEMVRSPTLYDIAFAQGLTTAQVDWVAIQNAPTISWAFPERPDPKGQIAQELVKAGALSQAELETFHTRNIVWRDHVWTEAAAHIIRQHRPNLMLYHLLTLDSIHHRYGPRTLAGQAAMAALDAHVARILAAIEQSGSAARTAVFVVSDHGFRQTTRQIRLNAALAKAGLLTVQDGKVVRADAYVVPEGGTAIVYVTAPDASGAILARARQAIEGVEGVATLVEPAEYAKYGLPDPGTNSQMGALFVIPRDGYSFTAAVGEQVVVDAAEGGLGAHGYVATDPDLGSLFIAAGAGVRSGVTLETVDSIDVAPTIASLLGLQLSGAEGKVLESMLQAAGR